MSSPPTPNTSVKAAPLCTSRPKEKFSSFPFAALNLFFHKKLSPRPSSPVEPYEVALPHEAVSSDATAGIFGYLDTNDKSVELRVQSADPDIQATGQKAKRKPVPSRESPGGCKQAQFMGRAKQCNTEKLRDESEAPYQLRQKGRDEEGVEKGSSWFGVRQRRMKTVSRDDQLVERGANPRTGLVSPFVVSDDSGECLGGDCIAVAKFGSAGPSPGKRTCSGKWMQDSLGWSLVESSLLSPIAQRDKMSRTISKQQSEDELLVDMPGGDNPDSKNMTDEQIKQYQESIAWAYKGGGGGIAMLHPDTLPSPRQWTPPSTPPRKLRKIRRKEIGSDVVRNSKSSDTVIIDANDQASSLPKPRKDIMEQQRVRIVTPSNTPKGSSFISCADVGNVMGKTGPFLGRELRTACSQTVSATHSQSYLNTGQAHQNHRNESESGQSSTLSEPPVASQTLSQYLPRLQLRHPSHFASLEKSPHRRPTQLRLGVFGQQGRAVGDACTTTFTTTSTKGLEWEQRPKTRTQDENDVVLRVNHLSPEHEKPLDFYNQASTPRNKQNLPLDAIHTSGLAPGRSQAIGSTKKADPVSDPVNTTCQRKTQMRAECFWQPPCEDRPRCLVSPRHTTQIPGREIVNVAQESIQQNRSGDGYTPIFGHRGNQCNQARGAPLGRLQPTSDDMEQAPLPSELANGSESRAWFAGQWAEVEKEPRGSDLSSLKLEETVEQRRSFVRKTADVNSWLYSREALAESMATQSPIKQVFHQMICHVVRTLHHASLALTTMRTANATTQAQLMAMKDLALATVYLLVLLNSVMVLRGVLVFVFKALYYAWHPIQTILRIIGWCVAGWGL